MGYGSHRENQEEDTGFNSRRRRQITPPTTRFRIIFANDTLSPIVLSNRGLGVEMSSRASLTAAIMAAAITSVDRNRSCVLRSSCSRAMARLISPMPLYLAPPWALRTGFLKSA